LARLDGKIAVSGLPAHRGLILSLCFYRVDDADAPAPHDGDPPAEAATDCHKVFEQVDLDVESDQATYDVSFSIERPAGFYYLQTRAILFRKEADKVFAQTEQVFFGRRPACIPLEPDGTVTLPFPWPHQRLEELHHHGVVRPQPKKAWWRFW
jgi:hypothetical protein